MIDTYSRQEQMFGENGQNMIANTRVGVVGLGGTGSQVVQALAYLGVRHFLLIDDDEVESTNLNRLIGAHLRDASNGARKTQVAERLIDCINPVATTLALDCNLRSKKALDALTGCEYIFGCVDNDGARLILMELAAAYELVLIDLATEIHPEYKDRPIQYGGRVVVSRPSELCLKCADQIDMEGAKQDLESLAVREARRTHGYGLDKSVSPSVVSLNGVIANLAVTEFLVMVTDMRSPNCIFTYYADRTEAGIVVPRQNQAKEECYFCRYLVGKREAANVSRYALD